MKKVEMVSIDRLLLWEQNPRVESARGQIDEINKIYNFSNKNQNVSKRQLINLAQSIAENGYQNDIEPILTLEDGDNYIVKDANRRLTAVKLLNNPDEYKEILDADDYQRILELNSNFKQTIPKTLDVISFSVDENDKLRDILMRKHNGPQDGVGTTPWGTEAKDRFTGKETFTDKVETQFETQFGDTLSSYIGGSQAKTSTNRIFNSKVVKDYLNVNDQNSLTGPELDKVKRVADEVQGYVKANKTFMSRINVQQIADNIITPLKERDDPEENTVQFDKVAKTSFAKYRALMGDNLERKLGSNYLKSEWLFLDNKDFANLNNLLAGLDANGELKDGANERFLKATIVAPAIRVVFELSIKILMDSSTINDFPNKNPSKELDKNVQHAWNKFKSNEFMRSISDEGIIDQSFTALRSVIDKSDFSNIALKSHLSSHGASTHLSTDEIVSMFNDVVLFAVLSEQFIAFSKQSTGQNN